MEPGELLNDRQEEIDMVMIVEEKV